MHQERQVRFNCPGCQASFTVPDDKIPKGRTGKIPCPKCHTPMEEMEDQPEQKQPVPDPAPRVQPADSPVDTLVEEEGVPLDVVEESVMTALVCMPDPVWAERIRNVFQQLDYFVVVAERAPYALAKLRHNRYDLVILDESFERAGSVENLVLHHVQLLPMPTRRTFFLCLVSEARPSMDRMAAFQMGVDLILNMRDLENLKLILPRAMKEHRNFYAVFTDELNRKGVL